MAVISFNFSNVYEELLLEGKKDATIVMGEKNFGINEEFPVFISESENMFSPKSKMKKIGIARLTKEVSKTVAEVTLNEARKCGYETIKELKESLKEWYSAADESVITYLEFNLSLD